MTYKQDKQYRVPNQTNRKTNQQELKKKKEKHEKQDTLTSATKWWPDSLWLSAIWRWPNGFIINN